MHLEKENGLKQLEEICQSRNQCFSAVKIISRARYSNVQTIIYCFEIQIQKPTDPVEQALTWSEYKKYNTLKYLISSTPDGFFNSIPEGYGGRISDSLLVEESGFLDILPNGCSVMADRGFKEIAKQLDYRNCQL
ncbi:hypothetical protein JTB14_008507 [Gonioctena quinquepunctata]|nr:hypothetical protein JTB14_008507 [Gonioctena quinquepunctata]